jgi:probable phosphoglycerate mutase
MQFALSRECAAWTRLFYSVPIVRIARHGETTWNAVGRYQGRLETPLSPLGQAQAQALGGALRDAGIERIISSPLSRCVQTALPLSMMTGVPIETDDRLLEIAHGTWEGRYRDELARNDSERYTMWRKHPERVHFPGGERLEDVLDRWKSFVSDFVPDVDTLLMTHDIVVRLALLERTGRSMSELRTIRAENAAFTVFEVTGQEWTLISECEKEHLAELSADQERQAL